MDLINRPEKTQLLKLAACKGITTISGVEMFIPQGVAQWELWTGLRAPESVMRKAVLGALRSEESPAAQLIKKCDNADLGKQTLAVN